MRDKFGKVLGIIAYADFGKKPAFAELAGKDNRRCNQFVAIV